MKEKEPRIFRPKTDTAFLGTPPAQVNQMQCRSAGTAAILCLWLFLGSAFKLLALERPPIGGMIVLNNAGLTQLRIVPCAGPNVRLLRSFARVWFTSRRFATHVVVLTTILCSGVPPVGRNLDLNNGVTTAPFPPAR